MSEKRPTKYERELLAELEQCRLEREAFRDGRNYLWRLIKNTWAQAAKREAA